MVHSSFDDFFGFVVLIGSMQLDRCFNTNMNPKLNEEFSKYSRIELLTAIKAATKPCSDFFKRNLTDIGDFHTFF